MENKSSGNDSNELFAGVCHSKKRAWLFAYSMLGHMKRAAEAAGVSDRTVRYWRQHDPAFVAAFNEAQTLAADNLLDAAMERATNGVDRLRFDKNGDAIIDPRTGEVYVEKQCSDVLLIFLLKNLQPEKFGDKGSDSGRSREIRVVFDDQYSTNPTYIENASIGRDQSPANNPSASVLALPPPPHGDSPATQEAA